MKSIPLKTLITLVATSLSLQAASATTKAEQLEFWKTEIQLERSDIESKFKLSAAREAQKKAFISGGVKWAQYYTDSWGGWIYMDWSSAGNLHDGLVRELRKTLMANRPSDPASEATMLRHNVSMNNFRWSNGKIRRLLQVRLDFNVQRGLEADKAREAHLAYLAATAAKASVTAQAMKIKEKYHSKRADEWAQFGAQTSGMIRKLGNNPKIDHDKFTKPYNSLLKLAKSGQLPKKTVAINTPQ